MPRQELATGSEGLTDIALLRHELRAPLTAMLGLAEMLAAMDLPARATYWLATLQACGQQMASLVDRALQPQFQQAIVGQHALIDGLQFAESLLAAHWPAAQAQGIRLMLAFHPEAQGLWRLDEVALRQALDNLLANAIRFSSSGTVLLEVRLVRLPGREGGRLEIAVENSAPGSACHVYNLRDQVEFADRTYRLSSRGHGLRVVEQVCRQLGGLLHRKPGPTGKMRYSLVLDSATPLFRALPKPFRPALFRRLGCILLLEEPQLRAIGTMLACLEIAFEVVEPAQVPELHSWPDGWILIASHVRLPAGLRQPGQAGELCTLQVLAKKRAGEGLELYRHGLPEPLRQLDFQNALLRCMVLQGLAENHARDNQL